MTAETAEICRTRLNLKFSNPLNFNDPFDCMPPERPPRDMQKRIANLPIIKDLAAYLSCHENFEEISCLVQGFHSQIDEFICERVTSELFPGIREHIIELMNNIRVLSLSKSNKNPLMWAHYGDNYRGVCIGYDINVLCAQPSLKQAQDILLPFKISPNKSIEYRSNLNDDRLTDIIITMLSHLTPEKMDSGSINVPNVPEEVDRAAEEKYYKYIEHVIFSKQKAWRYEKEHRFIISADAIHDRKIPSWDYLPPYNPEKSCTKKEERDFQYLFGTDQDGLKVDTEKIVKEVIFGLRYGVDKTRNKEELCEFKESKLQEFKKSFPHAKFFNTVLDRGWIAYEQLK